jgi:hypothetical protein
MGLVEEGEEVMAESKKKDDAAADLALIAAAQRLEHYEMSGYTTARNLAQHCTMAEWCSWASTNSHWSPSFQGPRASISPWSPSPVESLKN